MMGLSLAKIQIAPKVAWLAPVDFGALVMN